MQLPPTFASGTLERRLQGTNAGDEAIHSVDNCIPAMEPKPRRKEWRLEFRVPDGTAMRGVGIGNLLSDHLEKLLEGVDAFMHTS